MYLLFFGYSLVQLLISFAQKNLYQSYLKRFGNPDAIFPVISKRTRKYKRAVDVQQKEVVLVKKKDVFPFRGIVVRGSGKVRLSFDSKDELVLRPGMEISPGSVILDGELQIEVTEVLTEVSFYQYGCRLREKKKLSFRSMNYFVWLYFGVQAIGLFVFLFLVVYHFHLPSLQYAVMILLISLFDFRELFSFLESLYIFFLSKKDIYVLDRDKFVSYGKIKNLVFTKTGVLTLGSLSVTDVVVEEEDTSSQALLEALYAGEYYSKNRIGKCVQEYCKEKVSLDVSKIKDYSSFENGVSVVYGRKRIDIGNYFFSLERGITVEKAKEMGTILYISSNGKYLGYVVLSDKVLLPIKEEVSKLKKMGISHMVTFSHDNEKITRGVSYTLGIFDAYSEITEKDREFWVQYLRDIYHAPQAYISDEVCPYSFDVRILYGNSSSLDADIVILNPQFSLITELTYLSRNFLDSLRSLFGIGLFTKLILFFLLLWIRDIFIIGGILLGVVLLLLGAMLFFFCFIGKGDGK